MAIVKTYHFDNATVHIDDSYYRGVAPEELERRRQNMREVAGGILYRKQMRELEQEREREEGSPAG